MIKICPHCKGQFVSLNPYRIYCSEIHSRAARNRRRFNGDPETKRIWTKRKMSVRTNKKRNYIYEDKISKGCFRCPERRPHALQYHHVDPSTKKFAISYVKGAKHTTLTALKREIEKCIILCGNCHLVEENGDGYRPEDRPVVPAPIPGSIYPDTMSG